MTALAKKTGIASLRPKIPPYRRDRINRERLEAGSEEVRREATREEADQKAARAREGLGEVNARLDQLAQHLDRLAQTQAVRQRAAFERLNEPVEERNPLLTGVAPQRLRTNPEPTLSIEDAVAEIAARQRALDSEAAELIPPAVPAPALDGEAAKLAAAAEAAVPAPAVATRPGFVFESLASAPAAARGPALDTTTAASAPAAMPAPTVDFSGLEAQLRQITARDRGAAAGERHRKGHRGYPCRSCRNQPPAQ